MAFFVNRQMDKGMNSESEDSAGGQAGLLGIGRDTLGIGRDMLGIGRDMLGTGRDMLGSRLRHARHLQKQIPLSGMQKQ